MVLACYSGGLIILKSELRAVPCRCRSWRPLQAKQTAVLRRKTEEAEAARRAPEGALLADCLRLIHLILY